MSHDSPRRFHPWRPMPDDTNHPQPASDGGVPQGSTPPSGEDDLIAAARLAAQARSDGLPPEPDLPAPDYFPGYVVSREIHRGGQGIVYQAIHKGTKRKVAIKVMREGALASIKERTRFEREVEILAQLDHPNIVNVHDSGRVEGRFYYVMDYISGATLDVWISQKEMPITEILELFAKICEAVNAAHLKGVIHRDLKPANVRVDANGQPHIVDFGLAKVATGDLSDDDRLMTMTGQFIGSLPWASPEQAQGIPGMIDVRTDVYSLGVMLYQMLTGRFPYQVIGAMRDVLENILRSEPARPSTVRRQINDEIETIVLKCLAKDRERRYQNAGDVSRDILHYLRGEPIEAKRDSGWYVLRKAAKRHRAAFGAAGAFLVLLVAFAVGMSVLYGQKNAALSRLAAETRAKSDALDAKVAEAAAKQEIIDTLERWFTAPDPAVGQGKDVTVRSVVDRAAASVGADLAGQPLVEAAIRRILGRTYYNLGLWQEAELHLRRALEVYRSTRGPDDEDSLYSESALGSVLRDLGKLDEAESMLRDAMERSKRVFGGADKRTLSTMNELAALYKLKRDLDAAEPLLAEAVRGAEALVPPDPAMLAVVRTNLGQLLLGRGRAAEAEPMLRGAVEALTQANGADHPNTARARLQLGILLKQTGRPDGARAEFEAAERILSATLEEHHPDLLTARFLLAALLDETGHTDEALPMFEKVVAAAEATLPANHPSLAWYRHLYGRALLGVGRAADARPLLEQSVQTLVAANHPRAVDAERTLLRCCEAQGDEARAAELRAAIPSPGG
ncbi:MAG: serine/threonine protein kinase [Phycisphaerales bacterium]|nr:serine/threonine protein kinase [Phycisphaerales bacterium]